MAATYTLQQLKRVVFRYGEDSDKLAARRTALNAERATLASVVAAAEATGMADIPVQSLALASRVANNELTAQEIILIDDRLANDKILEVVFYTDTTRATEAWRAEIPYTGSANGTGAHRLEVPAAVWESVQLVDGARVAPAILIDKNLGQTYGATRNEVAYGVGESVPVVATSSAKVGFTKGAAHNTLRIDVLETLATGAFTLNVVGVGAAA
jgi:hypothetical protein